jgi:hypothetical protein
VHVEQNLRYAMRSVEQMFHEPRRRPREMGTHPADLRETL